MTFDWSNFHDSSTADFLPCTIPQRHADFESASGSRYWHTPAGVIRASDHWQRGIRSCNWYLAGAAYRGPERAGHCRWEDFRADKRQCAAWRMEQAAWLRANRARQQEERCEAARLAALLKPGNRVAAVREVSERLCGGRFQRVVERVIFVFARATANFYVATDGRRFARHTLRDFAAAQ